MNRLVIGMLAHVDAGKTTLSEAMLYQTGAVRRLGRVDHGDAFLDTEQLERERGITIFSKQAVLSWGDTQATLLDTPGHADFSAEMERTLWVLDCAVLVISGTDGVQSHTRTLWQLLKHYQVPVFLFVNKMDLPGADQSAVLEQLQRLDEGCLDFGAEEGALMENIAASDEALLERYLEGKPITDEEIRERIRRRRIFPCFFGSALKLEGIEELLAGLERWCPPEKAGGAFAARVFKISRDGGERLTWLKVTGGALRVKDLLSGGGDAPWQEKVNQIRVYSGAKYRTADTAEAGTVCAVTGLTKTRPGEALGAEQEEMPAVLEPVLTYRVVLPEGCSSHTALQDFRQLEEEDPQLRVLWKEALGKIHVQLMGEVQLEVLTRMMEDRFGLSVSFDEGGIVYKETISAPAVGIGHFEPLRHYAEVHLLLEPGERGSGLQFDTACPTDQLDGNWQRLVLTHLREKRHLGVLTGSALTDVKIILLAGRAHVKHTEGGDFRQATYRAVRQGLMGAENVLLEPVYAFTLSVPQESVGRAMADVQQMGGTFESPALEDGQAVLTGTAPVSAMQGYWREVTAYTRGLGRLSCCLAGYAPCHNAQEVIAAMGYDPERDVDNPADSVFCSHGAGVTVKWDQVPARAHVSSGLRLGEPERPSGRYVSGAATPPAGDRELEEIFVRTYGPIRNRGMDALAQRRRTAAPQPVRASYVQKEDVLLVDGYNMIFAWDDLKKLAQEDLDSARSALIHAMCNYQGIKRCSLTVVFDAYQVKGNAGSTERHGGIQVVYTKEGETADAYIERVSYELRKTHSVKVATSDTLERVVAFGHGARRLSAKEMRWELDQANEQIRSFLEQQGELREGAPLRRGELASNPRP